MKAIRRVALSALVVALSLAASLHAAGEGRIVGTVLDEANAPIEGVKVTLTRKGTGYKLEKVSDKKGQFMLLILDATQEYQLHLEKQGYKPYEGPLKPKLEDTMRTSYTLVKAEQAAAAPKELSGNDKAIAAYNEGVTLLKTNDLAGAAPKFEQAATLDPKLAEAVGALADVYLELGRNPEALGAADRYLALKPSDPRGLRARYDALKATGDNEKARATLEALALADPKGEGTAVRYFNEGAELTRAAKYDEAAVWFEKVVEISPAEPKFSKAHYVLGLTYAKDDKDPAKKARAKEQLQTFLQMAPNDADAGTAKQLLDYLK
ncbi:MAG TPA: carboxypeptidase regulatory-like domain-containing protein [Thermoanaerobaculia bacterium]|jgi:tetratricopeptide (TPR) repeat protein|nr:carboxypeptidase regulatory-like domain-containing protein [Thermoanaerobaculia bacterium]